MLGGLGAGLAIILMLVAWQLSSGPISLAFLTPYIQSAINAGHKSFTLTLENTILTWAGWQRTLDVRVINVRAVRPDGSLIGSVPEVSFSLSGKALLGGLIAPRSIELFGPRLRIRRELDGTIDVGFQDTEGQSGEIARRLIGQLLAVPDRANPMSYLSRLEVVSADVAFEDRLMGKSWVAPAADVSLRRDTVGLKGSMRLEIDVDRRRTEIAVSGDYVAAKRRFDVIVDVDDISPAAFSSMYYELGPLQTFDLPVKGTVTASITADGVVRSAGFNLRGGKGTLDLPQPIAQTLPVENLSLRGHFDGDKNVIAVDDFTVGLGADGKLHLPGLSGHAFPLAGLKARGRYVGAEHHLEITRLTADLHGPTAELTLIADGRLGNKKGADGSGGMSVDLTGTLRDVPVDQVGRYWPATWGADAHKWVVGHLSDGVLHKARAQIRLRSGGDGGFEVVSMDGDMDLSGVSVDYMPPMPPARDAAAYIKFTQKRMDIFLSEAKTEGLAVRDATVALTGLDAVDQFADVTMTIEGSFGDQLKYLDHEPLHYASVIGVDPKTTKGKAVTRLKLNFMMEKSLTPERVKVDAVSKVTDVSAVKAVLGRDINGGQLDIHVDKKGMNLTGTVNIGRIPATLVWRENFSDERKYRRRYDVKAHVADTQHLADLNPNLRPFTEKFVRGALDAEVNYTVFADDRRRLDLNTDITDAELLAPAFGWSKARGVRGEARMTMAFTGDRITGVPEFTVTAKDLNIRGQARYDAKGDIRRIDFDRVSYGRTNIKGALIARPDGGWDAGFHGPSFDMSSMWQDLMHGGSEGGKSDTFQLPYLTLAVELDKVWIGPDQAIDRISGTFAHRDDLWSTILLKGEIGNKQHFELTIRPTKDGNRNFVMTSSDAGETLNLMDFFSNMVGGRLEIIGKYNDSLPNHPLTGELSVKNYRVKNAPILTHVLSIMALTGIVEALQGDGLAFKTLDIPFVLGKGWLEIKNAKATGPSLGFTASGTVYTYADVIDITGTVVPAYAINSALGRLPVIGDIFTGGEKGGGVFAADFAMSGPAASPKVTVNPLSALTPGIFRNVFDIFGQAEFGSRPRDDGGLQ